MKYLILILATIAYSCKPNNVNQDYRFDAFEFAILNNEPVFEDEYLYEKT